MSTNDTQNFISAMLEEMSQSVVVARLARVKGKDKVRVYCDDGSVYAVSFKLVAAAPSPPVQEDEETRFKRLEAKFANVDFGGWEPEKPGEFYTDAEIIETPIFFRVWSDCTFSSGGKKVRMSDASIIPLIRAALIEMWGVIQKRDARQTEEGTS